MGRLLPDGSIEFVGRKDFQVKIRGYRVELGEIETVLSQNPGVRQVAIVAREDMPGEKRLVAYLVPAEAQELAVNDLRRFLRGILPDYMMPSTFVFLKALPLTPSGKVDRLALPTPGEAQTRLEGVLVAPRTPIEDSLVGIWAQVMGRDQIGIHDNFFELGGHSLLATQVVSRLRQVFQIELPLRVLFEEPTISGLAERVEAALGREPPQLPPLQPVSRDRPLPLSYSQERIWFMHQLDPNSSAYNMGTAVCLTGRLDAGALKRSFSEILRRHESLRSTFSVVDGEPVQVVAPAGDLDSSFVDLRDLPESERQSRALTLAAEEAQRPFNLERGPLFRLLLLRLGEEDHFMILNMHHIISDAWSSGVIFQELLAFYRPFSTGRLPSLPELPIQYPDFAYWERKSLRDDAFETQLSYWRRQLASAKVLELPTDRPRPTLQTYRGSSIWIDLPESLLNALEQLSRQENVTFFMTTLSSIPNFVIPLYQSGGRCCRCAGCRSQMACGRRADRHIC